MSNNKLNLKKSEIQNEALNTWLSNNCIGTLCIATGVGKTLVAINAQKMFPGKWLLVVPTEKLRDTSWIEEYNKWEASDCLETLTRTCYASLNKIKDESFEGIILDEAHSITLNNADFFQNNTFNRIIGLTATPPKDEIKRDILKQYCPVIYWYRLKQAVEDEVVTPFKIKLIKNKLEEFDKTLFIKGKTKQFYTTEQANYNYLCSVIDTIRYSGRTIPKELLLNRMRFLYTLPSKLNLAKKVKKTILINKRILIFAGSINHAEELSEYTFHSKTNSRAFDLFAAKEINELACVEALNEGVNLFDIEAALITKINSNPINLIQQTGRCIRLKEEDTEPVSIYIIYTINTQEEVWLNKSLADFDSKIIEYVEQKEINQYKVLI